MTHPTEHSTRPRRAADPTAADALAATIAALGHLVPAADRPAFDRLTTRSADRRLRVLVAGQAKRGKSTLINRLLDRDVLPSGAIPVTAVATRVRITGERDEPEHLRVTYSSGRCERHSLLEINNFVDESANPGNKLAVASVDVVVHSTDAALSRIELIDTPGTGTVHEHNTEAAVAAYGELDAVIMVLSAVPPVSADERDTLVQLTTDAVASFVIVNKTDQLTPSELEQTLTYTRRVLDQAGLPDTVWPMSARESDAGFHSFQHAFTSYLAAHASTDAVRALARHVRAFTRNLYDQVAITLAASADASATHRQRVQQFRTSLDRLAGSVGAVSDRVHATGIRLVRALDADATAQRPALVDTATGVIRDRLSATDTSVTDIDDAREHAAETIVDAVSLWREQHAAILTRELDELVTAVNDDLQRAVADVRRDADELFGLRLSTTAEPVSLADSHTFWFSTDPGVAWELPGSQLVRRHGPAAVRRARARLVEELPRLTDQQVGRARADLQQRLTESLRTLTARVAATRASLVDGLNDAAIAAEQIVVADIDSAAAERDRLSERAVRLAAILAQLDTIETAP